MKRLLLIVVLSQQYWSPALDRYMMKEPILRFLPDCPDGQNTY